MSFPGHRNEKHWLTDEELEIGTWGENLEEAVVEIKNLLPRLEFAFSGVEFAAAAIRAKELGFDRSTAFWPTVFPKETTYGMAWSDDPDLVAGIEPPPELSSGWKLDPYYGDRVRYWNGEELKRGPERDQRISYKQRNLAWDRSKTNHHRAAARTGPDLFQIDDALRLRLVIEEQVSHLCDQLIGMRQRRRDAKMAIRKPAVRAIGHTADSTAIPGAPRSGPKVIRRPTRARPRSAPGLVDLVRPKNRG